MGRKRKSEVLAADVKREVEQGTDNVKKTATTNLPGYRSQRQRKVRSKSNEDDKMSFQVGYKGRFTIAEREQLLAALKRHGPDDPHILAKNVPTRTATEIKWFLERRKNYKAPIKKENGAKSAPIQCWLEEAHGLTRDSVDYSSMLAQVMAIAGHYELRKSKKSLMSPNYTAIYDFLTQLLEGTFPDVTQLKPIDAFVILDLLQGLADEMKAYDLTDQKTLMLTKYKLLNTKIPVRNSEEAHRTIASAFQDDLLDSANVSTNSPQKRPVSSAAGSAKDLVISEVPSDAVAVATTAATTAATIAESGTPAATVTATNEGTAAETIPAGPIQPFSFSAQDMQASINHSQTVTETHVVVKSFSSDNLDSSLDDASIFNKTADTTKSDNPASNRNNTVSNELEASANTDSSKNDNEDINQDGPTLNVNPATKRKQGGVGQKPHPPVIEAKKSKLYTLNPFAIGVKYLKPPRKRSTAESTTGNFAPGFPSPT